MKSPKIIIVVCIYNRHENIRRWLHAWNMCEQMGATLIFVNNKYEGIDVDFWKPYCEVRGAKYYLRENKGYETGVIQDVILGNILKEEEWDVYFSFTDDTIPMRKDFLVQYVNEIMKLDVGVACMEMSGVVTPHIRTTGWCIRKDVANQIKFTANPIVSKEECYNFEHTGGQFTLMAQIINMNKRVIQMSNIENSAIWDTDYTKFNRWEEWHKEFPGYN